MAIAPVWMTGFEYGLATLTSNGGGLCSSIAGGAALSIQDSIKHSGNYALKMTQAGVGANILYNLSTPNVLVGRIYFYVESLPVSGDNAILSVRTSTTSHLYLHYANSTSTWYCGYNGSTADVALSGITISIGNWYCFDFYVNISNNPWTCDWKINGVAQTQATKALAANTIASFRVGSADVVSQIIYYDDMILSVTAGDYPIGEADTEGLSPGSDGIHSNVGDVMQDNDSNHIGDVTAFDHVNSVPIGNATTYIKQTGTGTAKYAEVNFADTSNTIIVGVTAILAYEASGTTANEGGCIVIDEDGTKTTLWGGEEPNQADYSETSIFYKNVILPTPAGGWDQAAVNALKARMGYSGNVTTNPYWVDLILEVAYEEGGCTTEIVVETTVITQTSTVTVEG